MREQFKKSYPHFKNLLRTSFIDFELYTTPEIKQTSKVVYNYSSVKNLKNISKAIMRNLKMNEDERLFCKRVLSILQKKCDDTVDDIAIFIDKKNLVYLKKFNKNVGDKHLVVYFTTIKREYGWVWDTIGRPVYKRLGWRILE